MKTYGRAVGLLTATGVVGLVLSVCGAAPEAIREAPCPHQCPAEANPTLPEPVVWEPNPKAVAAVKEAKTRPTAAVRETLTAELLATLEQTKSAAAFMVALEALVAIDAPAEKVVPLCLKALDRLDSFKPMPTEKEETQAMLLEGIGETMRLVLEKRKLIKSGPSGIRVPAVGVTVPAGAYLEHPPMYFPPVSPNCPIREVPAVCIPATIPEPTPTAPAWRKPAMMADPVPVQQAVPQAGPVPTTSNRPVAVSESGLIPVSTLPPAPPRTLEPVPASSFDPSRLVPVPR